MFFSNFFYLTAFFFFQSASDFQYQDYLHIIFTKSFIATRLFFPFLCIVFSSFLFNKGLLNSLKRRAENNSSLEIKLLVRRRSLRRLKPKQYEGITFKNILKYLKCYIKQESKALIVTNLYQNF